MLLGSVTLNTNETFRLNFCPETLLIVSNNTPVRVSVRALGEGVIADYDATGLLALRNARENVTSSTYYKLPLADGLLKNKNIEIDVQAHASSAATVYCFSTGLLGTGYIRTERTTVLANTSMEFRDFFQLALSAVNANDQITVNYIGGHTQVFNAADEIMSINCEVDSARLVIDNIDSSISSVIVVPTAQITVYKVSYREK